MRLTVISGYNPARSSYLLRVLLLLQFYAVVALDNVIIHEIDKSPFGISAFVGGPAEAEMATGATFAVRNLRLARFAVHCVGLLGTSTIASAYPKLALMLSPQPHPKLLDNRLAKLKG